MSWNALRPRPRIVLFGDEPGIGSLAHAVGAVHIVDLAYSPTGAPRLDTMFSAVRARFPHDLHCYVNADIFLIADFISALDAVVSQSKSFLMIGRRIDVDFGGAVDSEHAMTDDRFVAATALGSHSEGGGSDYFAYAPGTLPHVPPFALGRCYWDNWLIADALRRRLDVVDATATISAFHQVHAYEHAIVGLGRSGSDLTQLYMTPEAADNLRLAGGLLRLRNVGESTHQLVLVNGSPTLKRASSVRRLCGAGRRIRNAAAIRSIPWRRAVTR